MSLFGSCTIEGNSTHIGTVPNHCVSSKSCFTKARYNKARYNKARHTKARHTKARHTKARHTKARHTKARHTKARFHQLGGDLLNHHPTIRDVARLAGTSKSTVSRYLNGAQVHPETETALKKAIDELHFHPNVNARRLVLQRTKQIAVVVEDIANRFYSEILRGIQQVTTEHGYTCMFLSQTSHLKEESSYLRLFHEGLADGLLCVSFRRRSREELAAMREAAQPIVYIGDDGGEPGIFSVDVDNRVGIAELVRYLHRIGHRAIAYIGGPPEAAASAEREYGFRETLAQLQVADRPQWRVESDWSNEGGHRAMVRLLETGGFTAVIASNDETALGALKALQERGFAVPQDVSIAGFDNIPISAWVNPPLTTVSQPAEALGRTAAERLFTMLGGETGASVGKPDRLLLKPTLIVRQSCRSVDP